MKISKVTIENIRCFEHLVIDFNSNQRAKDFLVIIGDNGVGKTTVLRSIALGISEQSGSAGLIDELEGDWIRSGQESASIRIDLEPYSGCKEEAYILKI